MSALELVPNHRDYTVGKYLPILNIDEYWQVFNKIFELTNYLLHTFVVSFHFKIVIMKHPKIHLDKYIFSFYIPF